MRWLNDHYRKMLYRNVMSILRMNEIKFDEISSSIKMFLAFYKYADMRFIVISHGSAPQFTMYGAKIVRCQFHKSVSVRSNTKFITPTGEWWPWHLISIALVLLSYQSSFRIHYKCRKTERVCTVNRNWLCDYECMSECVWFQLYIQSVPEHKPNRLFHSGTVIRPNFNNKSIPSFFVGLHKSNETEN